MPTAEIIALAFSLKVLALLFLANALREILLAYERHRIGVIMPHGTQNKFRIGLKAI